MPSSIQGILAQKQKQQQQKTQTQQKGKPTQLPPSVQSLNPADLRKFLAMAFVKFMHSKMNTKEISKKKVFQEEPALKAHLDALKFEHSEVPTIKSRKSFTK